MPRYDFEGRDERIRYFTYHQDSTVVICTVCGALVHKPSTQLHTLHHPLHDRPTAAQLRKAGTWDREAKDE